MSRAFDEANDECVRIDYPTEKAPQYYNAEVYYGHLFVFYVAVFFNCSALGIVIFGLGAQKQERAIRVFY